MCNVTGICLSPERCGGDDKCESTAKGFTVTMVFKGVSFSKVNGSISEFTRNVLQSLWNVTNSSCIRDFLAESGSINVTFTMTPQKGQSTDDLIKTIAKLEAAVKSGDFRVVLPSGEVITADVNSFRATRITPTVPPPTTVATTTESSSNKTTIIIVCSVIGGLLLIVIIILVVYCCMKKKKQQRVSPNSSRAKLQEEVPMKDHPGKFFSLITCFACWRFPCHAKAEAQMTSITTRHLQGHSQACNLDFSIVIKNTDKENGILLYHYWFFLPLSLWFCKLMFPWQHHPLFSSHFFVFH